MDSGQKTLEISTNELRKILAEKSATVFDARPLMEYSMSHIPGALNVSEKPGVPISQYVSDVAEVGRVVKNDRSAPIVLYCNGPFCGKSKRLSEELIAAGYTNVRRYQLGIPMWRALVGITEIQLAGLVYVLNGDKTAVFLDARSPEEFKSGSIPGAKSLPLADVKKAKDDGRLPMEDHNTRIIVFGRDGAQALAVTEAIAKEAFHNVSFFGGDINELMPKIEQIGNRKPKRLALVAVLLALSVPAQAQQSTKIPRIGYLTAKSQASSARAPISTPSAKVYENSVTLRERTSSSSIEGPG